MEDDIPRAHVNSKTPPLPPSTTVGGQVELHPDLRLLKKPFAQRLRGIDTYNRRLSAADEGQDLLDFSLVKRHYAQVTVQRGVTDRPSAGGRIDPNEDPLWQQHSILLSFPGDHRPTPSSRLRRRSSPPAAARRLHPCGTAPATVDLQPGGGHTGPVARHRSHRRRKPSEFCADQDCYAARQTGLRAGSRRQTDPRAIGHPNWPGPHSQSRAIGVAREAGPGRSPAALVEGGVPRGSRSDQRTRPTSRAGARHRQRRSRLEPRSFLSGPSIQRQKRNGGRRSVLRPALSIPAHVRRPDTPVLWGGLRPWLGLSQATAEVYLG